MKATQQIRTQLNQLSGQRDLLEKQLSDKLQESKRLRREIIRTEKIKVILQTVAQQTQEELRYQISELATLAMRSVFDDPYEIKITFEQKRGKTEANILFTKNGNDVDPMTDSGGGAVDIASLALQLSLWAIMSPRTRNTFILDEPLKWLKGNELPERGARMIKEFSEKLGVQIIMVSHSPELIESADRVFEIIQKKGISKSIMV